MKKLFLMVLTVIIIVLVMTLPSNSKKKGLVKEYINVSKYYRLTDFEVGMEKVDGYPDIFYSYISCTDFSDFDFEKMFKIYNKFNSITGTILTSIQCGQDTYTFSDLWIGNDYEKIMKKNGEIIYNMEIDEPLKYQEELNRHLKKQETDKIKREELNNLRKLIEGNIEITDDDKAICWSLARDFVKDNLKSPSSAKFPFAYNSDGVTITKTENIYVVNAYVDADNSYGANIRMKFVVTIEKDGDKFVVSNVLFDE